MNRPIKGDSFRRGQFAHAMFQASANDIPNMRIKIAEGSFWINNKSLIEFAGGQSPTIEAPVSGAKWVLVAIDKTAKVVVYNGLALPNNPVAPKIDKNVLPIAFVFVKSATKVITNDMIYDARPVYSAGGYPEQHNLLDGRNQENCHPITAITGLKEALDDKISVVDNKEELDRKADVDGTSSSSFTLNKDEVGTPIENCGIRVNRGSQPEVGIRFNEDTDQWQYTNDGTTWHPIGNDVDLSDLATAFDAGITQLSVNPEDPKHPIAVGDNDPRLKEIEKKANIEDVKEKFVSKSDLRIAMRDKANVEDVYSKNDAEAIFLTRAEFGSNGNYTKEQLDRFFNLKANVASVYSRTEIDEKLAKILSKEEIKRLLQESGIVGNGSGGTVNLSRYYTSEQVNDIIKNLKEILYSKDAVDLKFADVNRRIEEAKISTDDFAKKTDVYTKEQVDAKFGGSSGTVDLSNYYTKTDANLLLSDKADKSHGHTANQITEDSTHRFVTDVQINTWNEKQSKLGFVPEDATNKGVANGYASLDSNGKIPIQQIPSLLNKGVGAGGIKVIQNYSQLVALPNPDVSLFYLVVDASDDSTVESGWAEYLYLNQQWVKIAEKESMDINFDSYMSNIGKTGATGNVFTKDEINELIKDFGKTGATGTVYTKNEVNTLLNGKADANHNHDSEYMSEAQVNTKLADYAKIDDARLHNANQLGTYSVVETGAQDGATLVLDLEHKQLKYKKLTASGISFDQFDLGSYRVVEPGTMQEDMSLVFSNGNLTYKKLNVGGASNGKVGSKSVDETDIGNNKYLVFDAVTDKFVYRDVVTVPQNLLDIDNTNRGVGKVLSYQANGKLGYVAMANGGGGSPTPSAQQQTYELTSTDGVVKGKFRADNANAVKIAHAGDKYTLTIDRDANVRMIQFLTKNMGAKQFKGEIVYTDGKEFESEGADLMDMIIPVISYVQLDGNNIPRTSSIFYDNVKMQKFVINALAPNYKVILKMLF